jgi:SagB-type dehydrogenase family enzyme
MIDQKTPQFLKFHLLTSIEKVKKILPKEKWPDSWKRIYFKGYPRFERISLDKSIWQNKNFNLFRAILDRRTVRESQNKPLSKDDLSFLLLSGGITRVEGNIFYDSYRAYPSGGARYPCEIYMVIRKASGLRPGLYHYHVRTHSLEFLWSVNKNQIKTCFPGQKFVLDSRAIIIITAIMGRSLGKYSERSYRYALLEAGHIAQNVYLISCAINIGCCALGGFNDYEICDLLDLRIEEELPLYCIAIL